MGDNNDEEVKMIMNRKSRRVHVLMINKENKILFSLNSFILFARGKTI
jgi:hypothetical protein